MWLFIGERNVFVYHWGKQASHLCQNWSYSISLMPVLQFRIGQWTLQKQLDKIQTFILLPGVVPRPFCLTVLSFTHCFNLSVCLYCLTC